MTPAKPHSPPSPEPPSPARLVVTADLSRLPELREFVVGRAAAAGLPPGRLPGLELVLEEAVVNVISHGYDGRPGTLELACRVENGWFVLELADEGAPFDPTGAADPDTSLPLEERSAGGLGLLLIRRSCDAVTWRREGGRNILTCRFGRERDALSSGRRP